MAKDQLIAEWVSRVPEIDPLTEGVVERIHLIARALDLTCAQIAAPHGLNTRDYDILARLYWTGEPHRLTPTQLAAGTGAPMTSITSRLDRLERLELIRRVAAPQDRRSLLAELTSAGEKLFSGLVREQAKVERTAFARMTLAELTKLRDLLDQALEACRDVMGPPPRRVEMARGSDK